MDKKSDSLEALMGDLMGEAQAIARMSLAIAKRIESLMQQRGLSQKQFAEAMGKRPSEISKWLSGEQNFTIATLVRLSRFFNQPIIEVSQERPKEDH